MPPPGGPESHLRAVAGDTTSAQDEAGQGGRGELERTRSERNLVSGRALEIYAVGDTTNTEPNDGGIRSAIWMTGTREFIVSVSGELLAPGSPDPEEDLGDVGVCRLLIDGSIVHITRAASMYGFDYSRSCVAVARVARTGVLVVGILASPGEADAGTETERSFEWVEVSFVGNSLTVASHPEGLVWASSLPGPIADVNAARAICDWNALESLAAPVPERGACPDVYVEQRLRRMPSTPGSAEVAMVVVVSEFEDLIRTPGISDDMREQLVAAKNVYVALGSSMAETMLSQLRTATERGFWADFDIAFGRLQYPDSPFIATFPSNVARYIEAMSASRENLGVCLQSNDPAVVRRALGELRGPTGIGFARLCQSHLETVSREAIMDNVSERAAWEWVRTFHAGPFSRGMSESTAHSSCRSVRGVWEASRRLRTWSCSFVSGDVLGIRGPVIIRGIAASRQASISIVWRPGDPDAMSELGQTLINMLSVRLGRHEDRASLNRDAYRGVFWRVGPLIVQVSFAIDPPHLRSPFPYRLRFEIGQ